jgi:hypothetical protein
MTVSDQPFYASNRQVAPRQPRVGEHLWAIRKDGRQLDCELRDDGEAGVEVLMSRDGEPALWPAPCYARAGARGSGEHEALYPREGGIHIA